MRIPASPSLDKLGISKSRSSRWQRLAVLAFSLISVGNTHAASQPTDAEIRKELLASWIVPPDSSDYNKLASQSLETFRADGTYTVYIFADKECQKLAQKQEAKWKIDHGILVSILDDGSILRDEILTVGSEMTLHSLDDGTTYKRVKSNTCGSVSS